MAASVAAEPAHACRPSRHSEVLARRTRDEKDAGSKGQVTGELVEGGTAVPGAEEIPDVVRKAAVRRSAASLRLLRPQGLDRRGEIWLKLRKGRGDEGGAGIPQPSQRDFQGDPRHPGAIEERKEGERPPARMLVREAAGAARGGGERMPVPRVNGRVGSDAVLAKKAKLRISISSFQREEADGSPKRDGGVEVARIAPSGKLGASGRSREGTTSRAQQRKERRYRVQR
jgi:hypothetical protein